jgi:2'-5' RNA ligase
MLTSYAADMSRWEDWQREYKYGVILIIPPDPPYSKMETLRRTYDPKGQAICGPHISVTVPIPRALSDANWYELKSIAAGIKPFTVKYGPLINYLPHPGVCLAIEPLDVLDELRTTLESAAAFKGAPPRRYPFSPHMTIAEYITVDETTDLMVKLKDSAPSGSFFCTSLSYVVPDNYFHFTERWRFDLF